MSPVLAIILLYGIMLLMVGAQTALFLWKKRHRKSYELITLLGLWIMPAVFSLHLHFWRFMIVWAAFSSVTGRLLYACTRKKMARTTPRQVYTFFLGVFRVSKIIGVIGYCLVLSEMMGMGPLWQLLLPKDLSIDLVWYGLYFGILGRDCAQVASDSLSARLGLEGKQLVTRINNCGICGNELCDELVPATGTGAEPPPVLLAQAERTVQLSCKHCFHDLCVRGWTMVGKKDTCPQCGEKVDLRALLADRPWETHNITWIQMMDGIRYLVVWNPIIFTLLSFLMHIFGPHRHAVAHHEGVEGAGQLGPGEMLPPLSPLALHGANLTAGVLNSTLHSAGVLAH
ncbi:RING finger protein [Tetrabaena socialis]|uniref:RING finger protein n=1 Tax=Tetrabaena socialis TaxID=47790 RepID=A0A2J8AIV1_9CHLO|nr:RING finger protein [Tetrabaena socialis]|eukprot:PNH12443.1 RING finger protein [Tetrabaena socialis]